MPPIKAAPVLLVALPSWPTPPQLNRTNVITDTQRLNWLIARSAFVSHSRDGEVCNVWFSQDPEDDSNGAVPVEGYPQKCYHDAREAIDAAMKGRSP